MLPSMHAFVRWGTGLWVWHKRFLIIVVFIMLQIVITHSEKRCVRLSSNKESMYCVHLIEAASEKDEKAHWRTHFSFHRQRAHPNRDFDFNFHSLKLTFAIQCHIWLIDSPALNTNLKISFVFDNICNNFGCAIRGVGWWDSGSRYKPLQLLCLIFVFM